MAVAGGSASILSCATILGLDSFQYVDAGEPDTAAERVADGPREVGSFDAGDATALDGTFDTSAAVDATDVAVFDVSNDFGNLLLNPDFQGSRPCGADWSVGGGSPSLFMDASYMDAGQSCLLCDPGYSDSISQQVSLSVPLAAGSSLVASAYVSSPTADGGIAQIYMEATFADGGTQSNGLQLQAPFGSWSNLAQEMTLDVGSASLKVVVLSLGGCVLVDDVVLQQQP
jgi:hypothetical protein